MAQRSYRSLVFRPILAISLGWANSGAALARTDGQPSGPAAPAAPTTPAGPSASTAAAPGSASPAEQKAIARFLLGGRLPLDEMLFFIALGGASRDSVRAMRAELQKRGGGAASAPRVAPKIVLDDKDRLIVDGRDTGAKIQSYSPLQVNFQGAVWSYDRSQAADINFKNLLRLFDGSRATAMSRLLLPFAEGRSKLVGELALAATGACVILLALTVFEGLIATGTLAAVAKASGYFWMTLVAGTVAVAASGDSGDKAAVSEVRRFTENPPTITCDDDFVRMAWPDGRVIAISKATGETQLTLADHKPSSAGDSLEQGQKATPPFDRPALASPMRNRDAARACKNNADAGRMMGQLRVAAETSRPSKDAFPLEPEPDPALAFPPGI